MIICWTSFFLLTFALYFSYLDNFAYPNTILNSENKAVQITEVPLYNNVMLFHVVGGGSPLVCSGIIVVLLLVSFAVSMI